MKPFITRVLIFITPIVTLCLATELLLRNIPNDYKYKRQTLDDNAESIETLILGSSPFYYGIDPEYMGNHTYNAAYVSQTLEYDHALFKKYVKWLKHLKTLILPADYFSLYLSLDKSIES